MKKLVSLLLTIALLLTAVSAFAETAADTKVQTLNFGDFSMDIDPEMKGDLGEKADNQVYLILYPLYNETGDQSTNFNAVWTEAGQELTEDLTDTTAQTIVAGVSEQLTAVGYTVTGSELLASQFTELGGLPCIALVYSVDLDVSGTACTLYYEQGIVSDAELGTWTFTGTTQSTDLLMEAIDPLFDAISWN